MIIPEQAVAAAARALMIARHSDPDLLDTIPRLRESVFTEARAILTAALPLMGVQRPEDVSETIRAKLIKHWASAPSYIVREITAAILALPHTGQEGWRHVPPEWIEFYQKHQPTVAELQELIVRFRKLPPDVRRLVVAARVVAYENQDAEALKELDEASEAFADRMAWKDEPAPPHIAEERGPK